MSTAIRLQHEAFLGQPFPTPPVLRWSTLSWSPDPSFNQHPPNAAPTDLQPFELDQFFGQMLVIEVPVFPSCECDHLVSDGSLDRIRRLPTTVSVHQR